MEFLFGPYKVNFAQISKNTLSPTNIDASCLPRFLNSSMVRCAWNVTEHLSLGARLFVGTDAAVTHTFLHCWEFTH